MDIPVIMTRALADAEGFSSHTPSLSVGQVGQDMGPCRNGLTGKYGLWEALKVCDGQLVLQAFVCCLTVQRVLQAVTHQPLQAASTHTHARTHAGTHTHTHTQVYIRQAGDRSVRSKRETEKASPEL